FELFSHPQRTQRIFDSSAGLPKLVHQPKHLASHLRRDTDYIIVDLGGGRRQQSPVYEELLQDHVTHPETKGGEVRRGHAGKEIVVTAAAGYRPQLATRVEELEDESRVVRQATNDAE